MTPIAIGHLVQLSEDALRHFPVSFATRVKGRTGTVESVFVPLGCTLSYVRVRWHKRGQRGKEFVETHRLDDLEAAS